MNPLTPFLERQGVVVLDGGLATELETRGFDLGDKLWSARLLLEQPEAIRRLHRDYLEAGADCVISASYQATALGFARRGIGREAAEDLLRLSVDLAAEARDDFWSDPANRRSRLRPLVAASVGPYGAYLANGSEYTGDYDLDEDGLAAFHRRRLEVLAAAGADLLACETVPSRAEARALARLLDEVPGPPAWLSFCCRDDRRLSDGSDLAATVAELDGHERIVAFGVNCVAPRHVSGLLARLREATSRPLAAYPNSGEIWDASGKRWQDEPSAVDRAGGAPTVGRAGGAPTEDLGAASAAWREAGARLIGGCCRTGPRDVRAIRERLLAPQDLDPAAVELLPSTERFIACADAEGRVRDAFAEDAPGLPLAATVPAGTWSRFRIDEGVAVADGPTLAAPGSALADLYALAARRGLSPLHSTAVMAETARVVADPGIDDPALDDLTRLPFVTIDEPHSRDLDQALFVERRGHGYTVWYAIADPAWSVRPGTAVFAEALARGATYYLPGLVIPMLPRELSEDVVSLNEGVDRRAMVFEVELDPDGRVERSRIRRARVRSRVKTSYDAVQRYYDGEAPVPGGQETKAEIAASLELLAEVGKLRVARAEARGVVSFRRREVAVSLSGRAGGTRMEHGGAEGLRFVALADPRNDVERYNEQISLLCNVEGARFLMRGDTEDDEVQPIYRVHDPPAPERLEELERQIAALVRRHRLDAKRWGWRPGEQSLADYLRALPSTGPEARLARSIHRQAMLTGGRSMFDTVPGKHFGVGADVYGRFTAPMREIVGVFAHKEAWEKLEGHRPAPDGWDDDEALRRQVVEAANRARQTQRELDREVNRRVLDQIFGDDLERPLERRPRHRGTVMGVSRSKVHVSLDQPPIDVKVYIYHLRRRLASFAPLRGDARRLAQGRDRITLRRGDGRRVHTVGDEVAVRVTGRDRGRDRWELELVSPA